MALRFRRTLKIAPGVRLNLTKTGVSARVGPRGAGVTLGTSGTTVSAGIPGTGLHMSEKLTANPNKRVDTVENKQRDKKFIFSFIIGTVTAISFITLILIAVQF